MGMVFGIVSAITWGSYGTFYSLLLGKGVQDLTLVALAPLAMVLYFGIRVLMKPHVLKEISWKYYLGMILQGIVIANGMNYCYSQAYSHGMAVGIVSVIAFTNILVIMVETYFLMKYKFTLSKVISMVMAMVGVSLVLEIFTGGNGVFTAMGLMWTILIPIFYGTNVTLNSFFIVKGCDSDAILFITQGAALLFMLIFQVHPIALIRDLSLAVSIDIHSIWLILGFCAIPQVICFMLMQECLKRTEPSIFGICYSLDPVASSILGVLIFAQPLHLIQIIGIVMILAAVAYINYAEGKENQVAQVSPQ